MIWKIKIIDIRRKSGDFVNIYVYFSLLKENPLTNQFELFFKEQVPVAIETLKGKSKTQKESFIKDFIKLTVEPLIDTFQSNVDLDDLIGYEEIL